MVHSVGESNIINSEDDLYLSNPTLEEFATKNNLTPAQIEQCERELEKERLQKVKPKMLEKLELNLHNGKVKEVNQFGQILIENAKK